MAKTSVTVDTSKLDAILKHLDGNMANAIAKAGFAVEAQAKLNAPVDTGALRASIYTSLHNGGRGTQAMAQARSLRPEAVTTELPTPRDGNTAYVGPSVEYGAEVELGSSRRPGTPYLQPAVRAVESEFKKLLAKAVTDA